MTNLVKFKVLEGKILGFKVYRGFGRICDLARISQADIYSKEKNPEGTQRDLKTIHARTAYEYAKNVTGINFFPEVTLSLREPSVISFVPSEIDEEFGILEVDMDEIEKFKAEGEISISRLDGNHRLHFADGETKGYPPLESQIGFCLLTEIDRLPEIKLFRDVNGNQMRMNTSHLDNILVRLTEEDWQKANEPELYIADKLSKDKNSALYKMTYDGGEKLDYFSIPLRTLKSGIKALRSSSRKLRLLGNTDAEYKVISNYWLAVKKWQPEAWQHPRDYLILRGAGLWAVCYIGAEVIDRSLDTNEYDVKSMLEILRSGEEWNWRNTGHFRGYSGQGGARKMAQEVITRFESESANSIASLTQKILDED